MHKLSKWYLFVFFCAIEGAVLTRDFIKDALYNNEKGYNRNKKVGVLDEPFDFGSLWGKWEFNKKIRAIYDVRVLFRWLMDRRRE